MITKTSDEEKNYEATVKVHLPGYSKPTEVKITVKATGLPEATEAVIAAWYAATEPKDIAIKEISTRKSSEIQVAS